MRKIWSKWVVAVAVVAFSAMATETAKAQGSVSLQVFYDELQPYGTWIDHGRYGYVWMPNEGGDFVPYGSNGYWVQTGYGNTWVSNYSWGWAPFHYGRWFYDDFYGWLWVPDTNWGPAWVTWRSGGGYYGWAPLMPGLSISMNVGYYNHIPAHYWNFVPYRYVMYRQVYRHCVPRPRVVNVINHTTVIVNNNYYNNDGPSHGRNRSDGRDRADYFTGPSRTEIERHNGERVPVYEVHDRNRPGQSEVSRSSVSLYKPTIERSTRTQALPSQVTRDNAQGRENISETRSRQLREQRSGESFDDNRDAMRRTDGLTPGNGSSRERESSNDARRDLEDLRREVRPDRRSTGTPDRSNSRSDVLDRTNRDADFNRMQGQREAEILRRQQQRQREQLNRPNTRESDLGREQQPAQQRPQRQSEPFQQPRQRQYETPRQSPSRQPAQSQQQTSPSRQQQLAPSQQRSSQPRMSSEGRGTSPQIQRPSGTRSNGSQRSRD